MADDAAGAVRRTPRLGIDDDADRWRDANGRANARIAELRQQLDAVGDALHGLDSDLGDDATLDARVKELHESYLDMVQLNGRWIDEISQLKRDRDLAVWLYAEANYYRNWTLKAAELELASHGRAEDKLTADLRLALWLVAEARWQRDENLADADKFRDYLSMANRLVERRGAERDALQARIATINETLGRAAGMMATDSRDWGRDRSDVWLYGLIAGWECEEQHEHDDVMCGGDGALREVCLQHAWSVDDVLRIRRFRAALQGDQPTEPGKSFGVRLMEASMHEAGRLQRPTEDCAEPTGEADRA